MATGQVIARLTYAERLAATSETSRNHVCGTPHQEPGTFKDRFMSFQLRTRAAAIRYEQVDPPVAMDESRKYPIGQQTVFS
mmetsp:Transcript_26365/g.102849  ORF Transcript_26365/g.102849 Transcript_26365/m.102849 type:complete len:81 (+) Transcript_26365:19-261(+)